MHVIQDLHPRAIEINKLDIKTNPECCVTGDRTGDASAMRPIGAALRGEQCRLRMCLGHVRHCPVTGKRVPVGDIFRVMETKRDHGALIVTLHEFSVSYPVKPNIIVAGGAWMRRVIETT